MKMIRTTISLFIVASLCACSSHHDDVRKASLGRTLTMVDGDNVRYGTVELNPVGGGRVYDIDGRLIGDIVPADHLK